jgi:hypothetical protein
VARNSKQRNAGPRHVRLCHYMMDSPAWKSLGCGARAVYLDMAKRYAGVGSNNGRIGYSVREAAAELHIGTSTAKRALNELQDRGFIVTMKKGAFIQAEHDCSAEEAHAIQRERAAARLAKTQEPDQQRCLRHGLP